MSAFTCPKCGGSTFGSWFERSFDEPPTRVCHGIVETSDGIESCRFSWPAADDAKYGLTQPDDAGEEIAVMVPR